MISSFNPNGAKQSLTLKNKLVSMRHIEPEMNPHCEGPSSFEDQWYCAIPRDVSLKGFHGPKVSLRLASRVTIGPIFSALSSFLSIWCVLEVRTYGVFWLVWCLVTRGGRPLHGGACSTPQGGDTCHGKATVGVTRWAGTGPPGGSSHTEAVWFGTRCRAV